MKNQNELTLDSRISLEEHEEVWVQMQEYIRDEQQEWEDFMLICDDAVRCAKDWLSVEEKLAALDEYYSNNN